MTSTSLLALLNILASTQSSRQERNKACNELNTLLQDRLPGLLKDVGRKLSEEDREDILQHILQQASVGTARCKALSEAESWGWCKTVARNFAIDMLQKQSMLSHPEQPPDDAIPESTNELGMQQAMDVARQQIERAKELLARSSRGKDKVASAICAVDYCMNGATIEEQIARWAFPGGPPAAPTAQELRKARNRVYAYRSRGVNYLLEALDELEKKLEFDAHELQFIRNLLGRMRRG